MLDRVRTCKRCGSLFVQEKSFGRPREICEQCNNDYGICETCGKRFRRSKPKEKYCSAKCRPKKEVRVAFLFDCIIYEAEGRCSKYFTEGCLKCLDFCARHDWIGWRSLTDESIDPSSDDDL